MGKGTWDQYKEEDRVNNVHQAGLWTLEVPGFRQQ